MFDKNDFELRKLLGEIQGQFASMTLIANTAIDCLHRIEKLNDGSFACKDAHVTMGEIDKILAVLINANPRT